VFVLPGGLYSQQVKEYHFVNINEGITKVAVSTILQDHYGFTWLGTNGAGLYRFDGNDYTTYKHEISDSTSLSSSLVICSILDSKNRLWVGTQDGLNLYDRDLDGFVRIPFQPRKNQGMSNIQVTSILEDPTGAILIGTVEFGHFKLEHPDSVIKKVPYNITGGTDVVTVNSIVADHHGRVYSGSNLGLEEYNRDKNFYGLAYLNTEEGLAPFEKPVETVLVDEENSLWVGTLTDGLYKIERGDASTGVYDKISHFNFTDKRILSMIQLPDSTLMIGTENAGLFHIAPNGNLLEQYVHDKSVGTSILSNSIWSLFLDKEQRIWLGTYNSGVGVHDELYDKFDELESLPYLANSLANGSVSGLVQDDNGKVWISMDGGGIDTYDPLSGRVEHIGPNGKKYSGLVDHHIQTIFIDSKKNLWAGSWNNGLFLLKKGSYHFKNHNRKNHPEVFTSNRVLSFAEDADGIIWIGTFNDGIVSYDPDTEQFTRHMSQAFVDHQLNTGDIRKVLVDSKNNIWVGATKGLFKIKKSGLNDYRVESMATMMVNSNQYKTSANPILSLYEDSKGTLWIGTMGSGLSTYQEPDNEFISYNKKYGLEEETVVSIIESNDGDIWICGNSGISRIELPDNHITNYTSSDGLLSNDFNFNSVLEDTQGKLYFGNYKGVDFFDPATISYNQVVPAIYLTGLKVFNQEVLPNRKGSPLKKVISETDSITFNNKQSVFTIEYTGINYTRPEKNQYAYYLEGLEDSWNYVGGQRNATYTNLNPGEYYFKLKASNNDGVWNENPLTLKITILPPWWKTNVAIMAYLICFLFFVYLLNRFTRERVEQKAMIRRERDQRLREEKLHEQKLQFFTNISHEFRTPLTLIINPLKDIISDESLQLPDRVKAKHNIIYRNTDRLYRLINELMDFSKLEHNKVNIKASQLNLVALVDEVVGYFKEELDHKNIHLSVESDFPEMPIWADQQMLEKIIFNILSNAMQVTPEKGAISIDILSKDVVDRLPLVNQIESTETIQIIISDTGPGLTKTQAKKVFQRFYRVENLNNTYYGGTGIGLEVVRSFVHLHKGKVDVKSKVGEGTSFKVVLPKGNSHFKQEELVSQSEKTRGIDNNLTRTQLPNIEAKLSLSPFQRKPYTILIVEDNRELRNYLCEELKESYNILNAKNGVEGLKIARDTLPDLILTDVIMPGMDGFELCKLIKTDLRTSHIPLLMLTARTKTEAWIEGIQMGADAYMVKPFEMQLLKLHLDQLVTSRQIIFDKYFSKISGVYENKNTTSLDKDFIQKVLYYIHDNISDPDLSVELLSSQLNLSRSQLYRKVKTLTGLTVNEFLRKVRLQQAKRIIEAEPEVNISDVCYRVGFSTPSYFTKCFKSQFGVLPTEIDKIVNPNS